MIIFITEPKPKWDDAVVVIPRCPCHQTLQKCFERKMGSGLEDFTKQGNRRRDSHEMVTNWIHETWEKVATPACIIGGFRATLNGTVITKCFTPNSMTQF